MYAAGFQFFDEVRSIVSDTRSDLTIKKEDKKICIKQIIRGEICFKNFKEASIFKEQVDIEGFTMSVNSNSVNNDKELDELLETYEETYTDDDETLKIQLTYTQQFDVPIKDRMEIWLFLSDKVEEMVIKLAKELRIRDLKNNLYKLPILSNKHIIESEIFKISPQNENIRLSDEIVSFINNEILEIEQLNIIPFLLSEKFSVKTRRDSALKLLNKLFEEYKDGQFFLYRRGLKYIDDGNLKETFGTCYEEISKLSLFIGSDSKYYIEKLYITRKILFDALDGKKKYLDADFWKRIYEQSKNDFCLFVDDEVSKFISEKKEIIKEQYMLSKELTNQIGTLTKNLTTNLIFITSVFVSKFLIDGLSDKSTMGNISIYLGLAIATIYFYLFCASGDINTHQSYEKKLELMVKEFPKLYLTDDNILIDLEKDITTPELQKLKKLKLFRLSYTLL